MITTLKAPRVKGRTLRMIDTEYEFGIHSFMTNQMKLKKQELLVYALIYSYFKNAEPFIVSRTRIARLIGHSVITVDKAIDSLLEKEYIYVVGIGGNKIKEYAINIDRLPEIPDHNRIKSLYREELRRLAERLAARRGEDPCSKNARGGVGVMKDSYKLK